MKFEWNEECENAFQELKRILTTTPVLTTPLSGELFMIYCDASTVGLGVRANTARQGDSLCL